MADNMEKEEEILDTDNSETTQESAEPVAEEAEEAKEEVKEEAPSKPEKRRRKSDKENEALKNEIAELKDRDLRRQAEFDNFRKRTEKEKTQMFETGAKSVIEKILPIVDNFERGLATIPEEEAGKPFADGMAMIYKQLLDELTKIDVKPIEALGKEFDPNLHNAVMQVESEEFESGVVAQELQKGYTYRDSVVRHSMVAVVP